MVGLIIGNNMWVKFTERWREGGIGTYIWVEFSNPTKQSIQEYANELVYRNHYDDNEGWRGYTIEIHEFPPKEYIQRLINNCRDSINYNKKRMTELKELLKQI